MSLENAGGRRSIGAALLVGLVSILAAAATAPAGAQTQAPTTTTTTPVPAPEPAPEFVPPPRARLASGAGEVEAPAGTSTWGRPPGPIVHADDFGLVDPNQRVLAVRRGEELTLRYVSPGGPSAVRLVRFDLARSPDGPRLGRERQELALPAANPVRFVADFPPGEWVLRVSSRWPEGETTHSFRVRVTARRAPARPRSAGPATPVRVPAHFAG